LQEKEKELQSRDEILRELNLELLEAEEQYLEFKDDLKFKDH
jgi:hypothetical protein